MDSNRDQPRNLEGVLRLAVENTDTSASSEDRVQPMTDERRQFLQQALSQFSGPGPVDRMKAILEHLSSHFNRTDSEKASDEEEADGLYDELEELKEWCEDIDLACDFHKIGGFPMLSTLQDSKDNEFQWRSNDLIAALCQNNPYCQQHILNGTDQLDRLMHMSESKGDNSTVRVKALFALSSLLRGYEDGQEKFAQKSGYELLLKLMQEEDKKLCTKATFLLMAIMRDNSKHKKCLTDIGCVEQLLTLLNREHDINHEHFMAALHELLTDNPAAIKDANRDNLQTRSFLQDRVKSLKGQPEFQEECDHAKEILSLLQSTDESMDR